MTNDRTHYVYYKRYPYNEKPPEAIRVEVEEVYLNDERFTLYGRGLVCDEDQDVLFYAPFTDDEWNAGKYSNQEFDQIWKDKFVPGLGRSPVHLTCEEYRRIARHHVDADLLISFDIWLKD